MDYNDINKKHNRLQDLKQKLKSEFFGIDQVIDQIIDILEPWYLFNESQTHPLVINLWGLTGTGKTSLIKALAKELGKEQAFFRYEMNNRTNLDLKQLMNMAITDYENEDYIFCFDEFQSLRTLDEYGKEVDNKLSFNLWDFLDTGEVDKTKYRNNRRMHYLSWFQVLEAWHNLGFTLKKGLVHFDKQPEELRQYLIDYYNSDGTEPVEYMDRNERMDLFRLFRDRFETVLHSELFHKNANVEDLLELLYEASKRQRKSEKAHLNQALIFVMGNLDEAYKMSKDFNPDINADSFYESSLKINLQHIKKALQQRFRNEQIARLGNNHVIYPALNKNAYVSIIRQHFKNLKNSFNKDYNLKLEFEASIEKMVYDNGVYPTQGVRPLKSSLKTHIDAKLGQVLSHLAISKINANMVNLGYSSNQLTVDYCVDDEIIDHIKLPIDATLDNIRQMKDKNKQVVTAIHEAGHAVISICLLQDIPNQITCSTVDVDNEGFMILNLNDRVITKHDILKYIARYLAGLEAEKLIFGNDLATTGSVSDLERATSLALKSITEYGLGNRVGHYQLNDVHYRNNLSQALPDIEAQAQALLDQAQGLTQLVLTKEKTLLLKIANKLVQDLKLELMQLRPLINNYCKMFTLEGIEKANEDQPHLDLFQQQLENIPNQELQTDERLIKNLSSFIEQH